MKRKKKEEKEQSTIRTRDILLDLWQAKPALLRMREKENVYNPLIDVLTSIGEDDPIPQSKELQIQFGISALKFRKWLESLHEDFLTAIGEDTDMIPVREVRAVFVVYGLECSLSFVCHLPILPRIGEEMRLPFIRATAGTDTYYVENISYELRDSILETLIRLKPGLYNRHFDYLKHRARFENEFDLGEEYNMSEYQVQRFIRDLYCRKCI